MKRRTFLKHMACSSGMLLCHSLGLLGCSGRNDTSENSPRLVLLFATCSVSTSHLSPYNEVVSYTPNFARFASNSAVFKKHQTETGLSGVAYASIFSGSQADKHGVFDHPRHINNDIYLISEAFAENGYDAFYWGGHPMAPARLGYAKGVKPKQRFANLLTADDDPFVDILKRLASDKDYRAFILTTGMVTHNPYGFSFHEKDRNPETLPFEFEAAGVTRDEFDRYASLYLRKGWGFRLKYDFYNTLREWGLPQDEVPGVTRVIEYLYKCGIHKLDKLYGEVIDKLSNYKLLDESLVVFTSDHGETMCRDNTFFKFCHGHQLTPEVLSVPLIVSAPSLGVKPEEHSFVSRSIDLFPTMAGLCGLRMPEGKGPDGVDLSQVMTGQTMPPTLHAFSHTGLVPEAVVNKAEYKDSLLYKMFPERDPDTMWVSVRIGDMVYKLEKSPLRSEEIGPHVFDLGNDPEERRDLFDLSDSHHKEVMDDLRRYKGNLAAACRLRYSDLEPDMSEDERLQRLKSLGYI